EQNKGIHKVDWRLCPILAVLYLISHLNRKFHHGLLHRRLEDTLNMLGTDFNVALIMFFIPFVLFEVPSNITSANFK
ncbi:uncharacterized protein M421DRAFT_78167, partial [Didymella exigua CBS 183.55]